MTRTIFPVLLSFLLVHCTTSPGDVKEVLRFETVVGQLSAPPVLEARNSRLFLYLERGEGENREIIVCLAENSSEKEVLIRLADRLRGTEENVYIYGKPADGAVLEYIEGIDIIVTAVGYYDPGAHRYLIVYTDYGESLRDHLRRPGWKEFQSLIKIAMKLM